MSAVERGTPTALSGQEKETILQDLGLVRELEEIIIQDDFTLEQVIGCLSVRQQFLEKTFGRSLKGPQQREERSCRLALEAFANEQMTLKDLKPLKDRALNARAQKMASSTPKQKRGFFRRLIGR